MAAPVSRGGVRFPLLLILLLIASLIGGVVARMLPVSGETTVEPRM